MKEVAREEGYQGTRVLPKSDEGMEGEEGIVGLNTAKRTFSKRVEELMRMQPLNPFVRLEFTLLPRTAVTTSTVTPTSTP